MVQNLPVSAKPGRNDPCPCGSGKKYKKCCAQPASAGPSAESANREALPLPLGTGSRKPVPSSAAGQLAALAAARRYQEMEALATELVAVQPQSGFAWKALSVARQMQGKDALQALERAAYLLPDDPEPHSNLGMALRRVGRLDEAVACCRRALTLKPDIAEVWNNLGNALNDLGKLEDAVAAFRRALELKPDFAKPHNNLGNALQDLGKLDDAAASYRRALDIDPLYADAHNNLGIALRLQSRTAEAEICCRRALEIDPNCSAAVILLAELHSDKGQFAVAEELFVRAGAIEADSPEAWAGIAGLRRMTHADSGWLTAAERIVEQRLAPRREMPLRYAMGKYFDDVGDYAHAFENYRRANELAKIGRPSHDRERLTEGIDRTIELYDREWLSLARVDANRSDRAVFIVGMPRSGTTLAEQILASHGAVFGAGELPFWNTAAPAYAASRTSGENILAKLADDYLSLLNGLSPDARCVVDKMPANFLYLGLIHAVLPNARIIHLVRHPIDNCLSIYFQNFGAVHSYANDLEDLAHYHAEYSRIMEHWRRTLPREAILDLPYEGLVDDPEAWSRKMVEFIGLSWDPNCLEFHRSTRPVSTFSKWQARQRISKSSVARWRNYEEFVGPLLPRANSEPGPARHSRPDSETPLPAALERAKALHAAGRLDDAEGAYEVVLRVDPSNFDAHHNLGIVALQSGKAELAITRLGQAVASNPRHAQAHANLGTAHLLTDRLEEALRAYDVALEIDPRLAGGWRNRGTILQRLGRHEEAAASFQRCGEIVPGFDFAFGSMFESRRYACDWREFERNVGEILAGISAGRNVDRPFSFLSVSGSAEQHYQCAKLHATYLCPRPAPAEWRGERYDHPKIRVAYVSADYCAHVVMNLMVPIFESHDRQRFHTIGISLAAENDSDILRRAKQSLTQFVNVSRLSDEAAAKTIRELEVDIAVDLTGYTAGCRAGIFARRPAPVQVSYLGYAGTSGAAYFDYLIADRVAIPRDRERFFSERIVRLPHCFLPGDESEPIAAQTPTRQALGLPDPGFVFCAFGNSYKFNPSVFDVWMRLLREVPKSVLWLRDGSIAMRGNLAREAAARGVGPERLIFAAKVPAMKDHLARHRQADLFLDTLPFGAHATARDALWAGLPMLTCLGDSFASRVAGSLLAALNLPELATENLQDYAARALELAHDREQLAALRTRLALNLRTQPLFDTKRHCKHLESAYAEMWERAERGDDAISFDVT